jgi:hypothetical protein
MTEKILLKDIFTEKCDKAAYKNLNFYLSLLNYGSCEVLTRKHMFFCGV